MPGLKGKPLNNSLHKAIEIILLFVSEKSLTLKEISNLTGIPKATAYRLISTMEEGCLIQRELVGVRECRFRLGLKFMELGRIVAENIDIRKTAYPFMEELRNITNEAVQLIIREGDDAVYIEKVEGNLPIRLYTRIGRHASLYAGACPRALIAFLPMDEVNEILESFVLGPVTSNTITDKEKLREKILEERKQGYTVSYGELAEGTVAIAMPIWDYQNRVVAAVSIAGQAVRFEDDRFMYIVESLKACASSISNNLGYKPDPYPIKIHQR